MGRIMVGLGLWITLLGPSKNVPVHIGVSRCIREVEYKVKQSG